MKNFCDLSGAYFRNKPIWCIGGFDLAAIIIVVAALILGVSSVWNDSPIVDEIPHIGAGYSYIATGDHRLNPEHPPLAKDIAGISMKILGIKDEIAFNSKPWQEDINGQWEFGRKLIFNSGNDANLVVKFAKIPQLIFFILSAIIIFLWTRQLYGYLAALMALFLFSLSPTVLAHSRYVTTDIPALFGILIGSYFFFNYLENPSRKNLWAAGIFFGIAQLTKYSVFLLVPFFLGIAVIYAFLSARGGSASGGNFFQSKLRASFSTLFSTVLIIAIGYIFIVWPVYYFHTWNYPPELQKYHTTEILKTFGRRPIAETVIFFSDKPVIRGLAEYGLGLLMVTQRSVGGNMTYFMGEVRDYAWPQYFPVVYFIKEPLPFWGLLVLVWLISAAKIKTLNPKLAIQNALNWSRNHFVELAMLLWIAAYWYTSIRANLNIGVRHMMPVYGFTFILLAGAIVKTCGKINSKKMVTGYYALVSLLFGWYLYENLNVYPYYLTYFNQVAGGPAGGHRYVVDSNLDWGQDLKRLADWVEENNVKNIHLDYFGWADQAYYLKDNFVWIWAGKYNSVNDFLAENPQGGYMAVSASFYMGSIHKPETSYAWLNSYDRVATIGNSIFVWYIPPK